MNPKTVPVRFQIGPLREVREACSRHDRTPAELILLRARLGRANEEVLSGATLLSVLRHGSYIENLDDHRNLQGPR